MFTEIKKQRQCQTVNKKQHLSERSPGRILRNEVRTDAELKTGGNENGRKKYQRYQELGF
jgi:hypothetical protein